MDRFAANYLAFFSPNLRVGRNIFPILLQYRIKFGIPEKIDEQTIMNTGNLFAGIPAALPAEVFTTLVNSNGARIERIISKGHRSPPGFWYDQKENEWVLLLKGEAIVRFEEDDRSVHLTEGSYVNIAAHERHCVEWTTENAETIWLAVFY